jgi:hypothetical protein
MRLSAAWLLAAAVFSTACDVRVDENGIRGMRVAEGRAEDVWVRTYTLPADGSLHIAVEHGAINVRGGDGPQVEVRAEREARANTEEEARALLEKLEIREEVTPTSVKLTAVGGERTWAPPGLGRLAIARVEYNVQVPAGLALTLKTENGSIGGEDLAGALTADVVNGGVRVDLASVKGEVALSATNGGVRVTLPARAKVNLEASVMNGGIDIDDEFGMLTEEGRARSVSAAINGGGPRVSARTVNGGVRIRARARDRSD